MGMNAKVPLGISREHTKKFSPSWFATIHATVPFIVMLGMSDLMPKAAMAFTNVASVLGHVIGSRAERYRLKAIATRLLTVTEISVGRFDPIRVNVGGSHLVGVICRHCGEAVEWKSGPLQVIGPSD